jgi:hypothetical protein
MLLGAWGLSCPAACIGLNASHDLHSLTCFCYWRRTFTVNVRGTRPFAQGKPGDRRDVPQLFSPNPGITKAQLSKVAPLGILLQHL